MPAGAKNHSTKSRFRKITDRDFVYCADIASAVRKFIELHYGDNVSLSVSVRSGLSGFHTSVSAFSEAINRIVGSELHDRHIRLEISEQNGMLVFAVSSDECDVTLLGADLSLALLASEAGLSLQTDGNRLLLVARLVMSSKGILSAIRHSYILLCLEEAYARAEERRTNGLR